MRARNETTGVTEGRRDVRSSWGDRDVWDREYRCVRAIPSSLRRAPSRAFARLAWALGDVAGADVLDVGAGTGRHALHLAALGASVHAVDHSASANEIHRARVGAAGLERSVFVEQARFDVDDVPDGRYDVIVDSYVSCHLLGPNDRTRFLDALLARLRPGGRLYTSAMGDRDAFYRRHLVAGSDRVAVDPHNDVAKLLQSADTARATDDLGALAAATTERFVDEVDGVDEDREVHAVVITR